jgi:hypothetical protein
MVSSIIEFGIEERSERKDVPLESSVPKCGEGECRDGQAAVVSDFFLIISAGTFVPSGHFSGGHFDRWERNNDAINLLGASCH